MLAKCNSAIVPFVPKSDTPAVAGTDSEGSQEYHEEDPEQTGKGMFTRV
jgi:hypothetical protein